jgi:hypothetical protein
MAKERAAFGGTIAGIIGALLGVVVIDKLLPWEQFFEAFRFFRASSCSWRSSSSSGWQPAITESSAMRMNRRARLNAPNMTSCLTH